MSLFSTIIVVDVYALWTIYLDNHQLVKLGKEKLVFWYEESSFIYIFSQLWGKEINNVVFGKPTSYQYDYCEKAIAKMCAKMGVKEPPMLLGVGDNLDTDIEGANRAGERWRSVLTLSGLYKEGNKQSDFCAFYIF